MNGFLNKLQQSGYRRRDCHHKYKDENRVLCPINQIPKKNQIEEHMGQPNVCGVLSNQKKRMLQPLRFFPENKQGHVNRPRHWCNKQARNDFRTTVQHDQNERHCNDPLNHLRESSPAFT